MAYGSETHNDDDDDDDDYDDDDDDNYVGPDIDDGSNATNAMHWGLSEG